MIWDLRIEADDVVLACFGSEIAFPASAAGAVSALLEADEGIEVAALDPELSEDEKLVLVRRLVREGVAEARLA